jgi:hypothetical protein
MEWAIVIATLLGPVLAVQAQKWIEKYAEKKRRREWVFTTLMTTRGARLSQEHVRALNTIDLAFFDGGRRKRSSDCQAVLDAWEAYLGLLARRTPENEGDRAAHFNLLDGAFHTLLQAMAKEGGWEFDLARIRDNAYNPQAFADQEIDGLGLRKMTLAVLRGESPIRVALIEAIDPAPVTGQ